MTDSTGDLLVGRVVDGRYRVLRHLADGGMATVYVALDERLGRDVALKVMHRQLSIDEAFVARFRREARSAAKLTHPHVVSVFDQGQDGDVVFLAMELVPGLTLRDLITRHGALAPREALRITAQMLNGLTAAHRAGIVHRDVKPENVLISTAGVVKVADYGLARAIDVSQATHATQTLMGTAAYLSPEQIEQGDIDARADVYATGLVLFEMLTGQRAVEGETMVQIAYRHVHGQIPVPSSVRPELAPELDALVAMAVHRDRNDRPRDAGAYRDEVLRVETTLSPEQLDTAPSRRIRAATGLSTKDPDTVSNRTTDMSSLIGPSAQETAVQKTRPVTPLPTQVESSWKADQLWNVDDAGEGWATGRQAVAVAAPPDDSDSEPTPPPPSRTGALRTRRRRRNQAIPIVAVILVVLIALAGGISWYVFYGPGSQRAVPALVGMEESAARSALTGLELDAEVEQVFSETAPTGQVIHTDPEQGTQVHRAATVKLQVSKGKERVKVPELVGKTKDEAQQAITDARLSVGQISETFNETAASGQVISSDPKPGSELKPGTPVAMTVSKGRQPIEVQDFTGKPYAEAAAVLNKKGLSVQVAGEEYSNDVPKGNVIKQAPSSGTLFRSGQVTFTVSKGPDLVAVPEVRGRTESEASAMLQSAGFKIDISRIAGGLFGMALSTTPSAGEQVPRGSTIVLRVY
ncbi:Serine/threonine-protein kinase PK-1 [Austwickia sp. TVS 96-490-7B]|uniref:Stk1 family PASTA domain-containing Ser/Thr kinase n=1 Tax=Austwickia sp. TVS 96-490-7B TaxID=2830843 RepID=UPI001C5A035C|nr:Stk1 family PASTA domain-containing Ser/Thr kinase [Austwickia sp. TVS 96-490-7B]MBW3086113.1 Serine/threonine-protein kinase PK-1 [Austwickia sp. TVS 96-490-7B]